MDEKDLIAFSRWIRDKMYHHRLDILPSELTRFYIDNRKSLRKQYLNK